MRTRIVKPLQTPSVITRCTPMDAQLRWVVPHVGLCFHGQLDAARLADALARVLPDYHAFAGKLSSANGSLSIVPSADGVPFEVVERADSLRTLLAEENAIRGPGISPRIPPLSVVRGKAPVFAARLTRAHDGSALGVTWNHAAGDFVSVMLLLEAWAKAYRNLPHEPGFDPADRDAYLCQQLVDSPGEPPMLRSMSVPEAFRFAKAFGQRQHRVMFELGNDDLLAIQAAVTRDQPVTIEDAMWSEILMRIRELRNVEHADFKWIINMRKRVALPANLIGNATSTLIESTGPDDDATRVAERMRRQVQQFASHHVNYHATRRFILERSGWLQRKLLVPVGVRADRMGFSTSSLGNFDFNRLVFDPAAPAAEFCCRAADGGFWLGMAFQPPGRQAGHSRIVSLWLPERVARAFRGDEARRLLLGHARAPLHRPRTNGLSADL